MNALPLSIGLPLLRYKEWYLELKADTPDQFQLCCEDKPVFVGQLELINNGLIIDMRSVVWHFRSKQIHLEQWCNIQLNETLSLSMTYTFFQGALVIDYLARNSIPTRLDIRHHITQTDVSHQLATQPEDIISSIKGWQRKRNDQPSEYLIEPVGHGFCEAFSATQWIVLDEKCELKNRT